VRFHWVEAGDDLAEIVDFFVANLDSEFISHSELQGARAKTTRRWSDRLAQVLEDEMKERAGQFFDAASRANSAHCLVMREEGQLVGLADLDFHYPEAAASYCVFEDLLVDRTARGRGLGTRLFRHLEDVCRDKGIERIFFESGVRNHAAHRLFERLGCEVVSHYFMKEV